MTGNFGVIYAKYAQLYQHFYLAALIFLLLVGGLLRIQPDAFTKILNHYKEEQK
jgi:hypothetical protein